MREMASPIRGSATAGAAGSLSVTMAPASGGNYTAAFTFSVGNLIKAGQVPVPPLDNGSVIVAAQPETRTTTVLKVGNVAMTQVQWDNWGESVDDTDYQLAAITSNLGLQIAPVA